MLPFPLSPTNGTRITSACNRLLLSICYFCHTKRYCIPSDSFCPIAGGFMARNRACKECSAKEADGILFPTLGLLCKKCYTEQQIVYQAQYYKNNRERVKGRMQQKYNEEHPPRPCIDCGAPMPKRAQKYCAECKDKHDRETARLGMQKLRGRLPT